MQFNGITDKEDAECELNCKPIGMRYFATLNKTVIDGTPCSKPTEYFRRNNSGRGICVEGLCKTDCDGRYKKEDLKTLVEKPDQLPDYYIDSFADLEKIITEVVAYKAAKQANLEL
uniref:ADAMTS/ADAMTS-like cysteine-rich domain-containing protein n=1 Tax=Anopheles merus TaxID=30066 RepID=A0A182V9F5_ANOME